MRLLVNRFSHKAWPVQQYQDTTKANVDWMRTFDADLSELALEGGLEAFPLLALEAGLALALEAGTVLAFDEGFPVTCNIVLIAETGLSVALEEGLACE